MEIYYIPLPKVFIDKFQCMWSLMVEAIFLEWSVMLIGVCSSSDNFVILNPSELELQQDDTMANFFGVQYTTGTIMMLVLSVLCCVCFDSLISAHVSHCNDP